MCFVNMPSSEKEKKSKYVAILWQQWMPQKPTYTA